MLKYLNQCLSIYLSHILQAILLVLLFSCNSSVANAHSHYTGQPIDFANLNISSLYIMDNKGEFALISKNLNNKSALPLYKNQGAYQLKIFFFSHPQTQDIWLQLRTKQLYKKVTLNQHTLTHTYMPLNRLLLPKDKLNEYKNELTIEFDILDGQQSHAFLDIALANAEALHQQSKQYSIATTSYAVLFIVFFITLLCTYLFLTHQNFILFSAIFYFNAALLTSFWALFWLQELPASLYNDTPTILSYLMGLSFLIMNLSLMNITVNTQAALIIFISILLYFLPIPIFLSFCIFTLLISIIIAPRKRPYVYLGMLTLVCCFTVIDQFNTFDYLIRTLESMILKSFLYQLEYFALSLFFIYFLIHSAQQFQKQSQQHLKLQIQKKNLELQLINKHIQPHFLMNALMSVQQQIELSPSDAIDMIELLSDEFQLLHKHIGRQFVPLKDEIEMCAKLLSFMGKQQQTDYKLETHIECHDLMIPAGILHTFVENGVKHGFKGIEPGIFIIKINLISNDLILWVENNGDNHHANKVESGLGLHYVRQQLEMWQPNKWHLNCEPTNNGWKNTISIKDFLSSRQ